MFCRKFEQFLKLGISGQCYISRVEPETEDFRVGKHMPDCPKCCKIKLFILVQIAVSN